MECAEKNDDGQLVVYERDAFLLTQWLERSYINHHRYLVVLISYKCNNSCITLTIIRGVFEALEESYLKSLTFSVYKRNTTAQTKKREDDILLECYNFGISYTNGVLSLNGMPVTRETLKKQAGASRES